MKNNRKIFQYMIPGIVGLLFNSLYVIVDGIFVSQMLGSEALAAVTLVVPIVELIIALSLMVAIGTGIYISFYKGKEDLAKANKFFNQGFMLMVILTITITTLLLVGKDHIVNMLGATADIVSLTQEYYFWFVIFIPFFMLNFALATWIRNDGKPRLAMLTQIVGALSNIILDYVLMGPLSMGLKGAAIATGLGPVFGLLMLLPHFLLKRGDLTFTKTKIKIKNVIDIVVGGLPSFTIEFSLGIMTFLCNIFIVKIYQEVGIATFGVLGYINLIVLSLFLGMGQGTQPLISELEGRNANVEIKDMFAYMVKLTLLIGVGAYLLLIVFKNLVLGIFISNDPIVYELSLKALQMFFVTLPITGINILTASFLEARRKVIPSVLISIARSVVFLLLSLVILSQVKKGQYIWYAVPLSEVLTLLSMIVASTVTRRLQLKDNLSVSQI